MSQPQLYVSYGHIDLGELRQRQLAIHRNEYVAVDGIDPESHARQAPQEAEWFSYFTSDDGAVDLPVLNSPTYVVDAQPQPYIAAQHGQDAIQQVVLRHSRVSFPHYAGTSRSAVVSTR